MANKTHCSPPMPYPEPSLPQHPPLTGWPTQIAGR